MVRVWPNTDTEENVEKKQEKNDTDWQKSLSNASPEDKKKQEEDRDKSFSGDFSEENILKVMKKLDQYKNAKDYEEVMKILKDGNKNETGSGKNPDLYSFLLENRKKFEDETSKKEIEKKKKELEQGDKEHKKDEKKKDKEPEKKNEKKDNDLEKNEKKKEKDSEKSEDDNKKKWREEEKKPKKKKEKNSEKSEDEDDEAEDKSEKSDRKWFFWTIGSFLGKTSTQAGNLIRYLPRTAWNSWKIFLRSLKYFWFDILNFPSGGKAMEIFWKKYSDDMKRYKETFKWNYKKGGK